MPDANEPPNQPSGDEPQPAHDSLAGQIIYRSDELLKGRREVWIEHGADMYRLRVTSSGKLYLTK